MKSLKCLLSASCIVFAMGYSQVGHGFECFLSGNLDRGAIIDVDHKVEKRKMDLDKCDYNSGMGEFTCIGYETWSLDQKEKAPEVWLYLTLPVDHKDRDWSSGGRFTLEELMGRYNYEIASTHVSVHDPKERTTYRDSRRALDEGAPITQINQAVFMKRADGTSFKVRLKCH